MNFVIWDYLVKGQRCWVGETLGLGYLGLGFKGGHGNLVNGLITRIIGGVIWLIGASKLLTKSPRPSK